MDVSRGSNLSWFAWPFSTCRFSWFSHFFRCVLCVLSRLKIRQASPARVVTFLEFPSAAASFSPMGPERFFHLFCSRWPKKGSGWPLYIVEGDIFSPRSFMRHDEVKFKNGPGDSGSLLPLFASVKSAP